MRPQQPACLNCSQEQPQSLSWPETPFSERYFCLSDFKRSPGTTASWDPGGFYHLAVHSEKLPGPTATKAHSPLELFLCVTVWLSRAKSHACSRLQGDLRQRGPGLLVPVVVGGFCLPPKLKKEGDFPGSPVVKTLCFQCRGRRLSLKGMYVLARPKQ